MKYWTKGSANAKSGPFYVYDGPTRSYARHVLSLPPDEAFSIIDTFSRNKHISYQDAHRLFTNGPDATLNLSRHRTTYYNFF